MMPGENPQHLAVWADNVSFAYGDVKALQGLELGVLLAFAAAMTVLGAVALRRGAPA